MCQSQLHHHEDKALAKSQEITDAAIEQALETAESCFQVWCRKSPRERVAVISKAAEILRLRQDAFAASTMLGFGLPFDQAQREVALTADVIDYYAKHSESLPQTDPIQDNSMHFGVIFGYQPDSFPYFQLARMTAPNLVVGNVVVVKHAGSIPPCAHAFEELWKEAGAPAGIFTNLLVSPSQALRLHDDPRMRSASSRGADAVHRITRKTGTESHLLPLKSAPACDGFSK